MSSFLSHKLFFPVPLSLPPPSTDACMSKTKLTESLTKTFERPKSTSMYEAPKRYPLLQTLSSQYDDKIKKQRQRERESMMSSRTDTT